MSLRPSPIPPVPQETVRVARAAFPKGNVYVTLRDELPALFSDELFTGLFAGLFPECSPSAANLLTPPGVWRWRPFCSTRKGFPTGAPPKRCAAESTGSTCCPWS